LNRAIGRKMLIAAVRRARKPGCKFDYIIVFEGLQGTGKSSVLCILAGDGNFSDAEILGMDKQDQQEAVQGIWIYEIAELEGLSKAEVTKVKLFASKTHDMARPAYGRHRVDRPRRCIFVASTNDDKYLRDTTGNRRYWPIKTPKIDLDGIARDRDQLWAEAALAEATGEALVIPEELWPEATAQQLARMRSTLGRTFSPVSSPNLKRTTAMLRTVSLAQTTKAAIPNGASQPTTSSRACSSSPKIAKTTATPNASLPSCAISVGHAPKRPSASTQPSVVASPNLRSWWV